MGRSLLRGLAAIMIAVGAGLLAACDDDPAAPADAPDGHTVIRDGVAHAPGLSDPAANCASCHGANLEGGEAGEPSCFQCHGAVWN